MQDIMQGIIALYDILFLLVYDFYKTFKLAFKSFGSSRF
jgi:hypothetical protein